MATAFVLLNIDYENVSKLHKLINEWYIVSSLKSLDTSGYILFVFTILYIFKDLSLSFDWL